MSTQDKLAQALRDILDPIAYLERGLQEGERLNGVAVLAAINSREFYSRIAREALAAHEAEAQTVISKLADFRGQQIKAGIPEDELMPTDPVAAVDYLISNVKEWR